MGGVWIPEVHVRDQDTELRRPLSLWSVAGVWAGLTVATILILPVVLAPLALAGLLWWSWPRRRAGWILAGLAHSIFITLYITAASADAPLAYGGLLLLGVLPMSLVTVSLALAALASKLRSGREGLVHFGE